MNYYPPPAYVIRADRNGVGTAGLVVGICALALSVVPLLGVVAWLVWPVGVALSAVGMSRCSRQLATNRGSAVAGLCVSLTAAGVCTAWVVVTAVAASGGAA